MRVKRVLNLVSLVVLAALGLSVAAEFRPKPGGGTSRHVGFRDDVADADRGNAVFSGIWWSDDERRFVTAHHLQDGLRVWEASTGRRLATLHGIGADPEALVGGARGRIVAHRAMRGSDPATMRLAAFDLATGEEVALLPDDPAQPARLWAWADGGTAVVLSRPGAIELWQLEPPELLRSFASPIPPDRYRLCEAVIPATYHDKWLWELSPSGRFLAFAYSENWPERGWHHFLLDLSARELGELDPPPGDPTEPFTCFAFSADDRTLALGTNSGVWLRDLGSGTWTRFLPGDHKRNPYLAPMRFSADGRRLVALGDMLQVSVFDVASGQLCGRREPPFDDWEGVFRVSRDGSRVVLYHFASDTLEVLDGYDGRRIGEVCAYFCNARHNPVAVEYAVAPDGRTVAASHRYGAALWAVDTDRLVAPLVDPALTAARPR